MTEQQTDRPGVAQREVPPLQMILCLGNIPLISASQLTDNDRPEVKHPSSHTQPHSWLATNPVCDGGDITSRMNINFNFPLVTEGDPEWTTYVPLIMLQYKAQCI